MSNTAHIFETSNTPKKMIELIPYLDRIGHGIFLPLKFPQHLKKLMPSKSNPNGIPLEICPTTYFKCRTFKDYSDKNFKKIFSTCEEYGVDIIIGTDNGGLHGVRLQAEFENLLLNETVKFNKLNDFRKNAFKHAFDLSEPQKKVFTEHLSMVLEMQDISVHFSK